MRHKGFHGPHPGRDALHDAGPAQLVSDPEALVEAHRGCYGPKAVGIGEELEDHLPESLVVGPALVSALDLLARGLDELVVLHAGWAGRNAGHAPEAEVPVADHLVVHRLLVEALVHEVDAPARGVHLLAEEHVRRARRQAEPAVDAVVYEVLLRRVVGVESREHVAPALRRAPYADRLLYGAARGEGVVRQVFGAAGAYALRRGVLVRGRGVAATLRRVRGVVRVAVLARIEGVVVPVHCSRYLPRTCPGSESPGDRTSPLRGG